MKKKSEKKRNKKWCRLENEQKQDDAMDVMWRNVRMIKDKAEVVK